MRSMRGPTSLRITESMCAGRSRTSRPSVLCQMKLPTTPSTSRSERSNCTQRSVMPSEVALLFELREVDTRARPQRHRLTGRLAEDEAFGTVRERAVDAGDLAQPEQFTDQIAHAADVAGECSELLDLALARGDRAIRIHAHRVLEVLSTVADRLLARS